MTKQNTIASVVFDRQTPVMDREQIDMLLMVDEDGDDPTDLIRELIYLFETESRAKFAELDRICMVDAVVDLRKVVHFVAGSAGNLGLVRLAAFYRAIEQTIDSGQLTDLSNAAQPIRDEFESAIATFKAEFDL